MKRLILTFRTLTVLLYVSCTKQVAETPKPPVVSKDSLLAANNLVVYVASENNKLYAFDANNGSVLWTFLLNSRTVQLAQLSSPAYADGILYLGSTDQNIYAVDATNGKEVWHYPTNSTVGFFYSSPVVGNGVVYVSGYEQRFYAIDAKSGQLKWQKDFPREFQSSPAFYEGTVLTTSNDGVLYALDGNDGTTLWSQGSAGYNYGFDYSISSPCVNKGVVYSIVEDVAESSSLINELNVTNGTGYGVYSEFVMPSLTGYTTSPVVEDSMVYFAAKDSIYAVKTGNLMFFNKSWSAGVGGDIYSSPALDDSSLYVGCNDGYLYAFDKFTGLLRWKYNSGALMVVSSPVVVNGIVFCGCDNKFFALNARDGSLKWQTVEYTPVTSSPVVFTRQGKAYHGSISGMAN
jgi:outer membrane protein assembly factor BamB